MNNVINHKIEFIIFDNIILYDKTYEFIIFNKTIKIREMKHHFKTIIELINCKSLFNKIINNKYHHINNFFKKIFSFNQNYND